MPTFSPLSEPPSSVRTTPLLFDAELPPRNGTSSARTMPGSETSRTAPKPASLKVCRVYRPQSQTACMILIESYKADRTQIRHMQLMTL